MSDKSYTFNRENIINLLKNHKTYISNKVREIIESGKDPKAITFRVSDQWTEDFFDEEMAKGEIKIDTLLDQVDELMIKTHGKDVWEMAKKIKELENH